MIRVCSFLFITYFLHNNIQKDWLLYKKNTFNSAHTKQSATSEITTTKKKQTRKSLKYKQENDNNSLVLQVSLDERLFYFCCSYLLYLTSKKLRCISNLHL